MPQRPAAARPTPTPAPARALALAAGGALALAAGGALAQAPGLAPGQAPTRMEQFEQRLPNALGGMERLARPQPQPGERVVAAYTGAAGRAAVLVTPLSAPVPADGVSERARAEVLVAIAEDLREGTRLLGPRYWTAPLNTHSLSVRGGPVLTCALLERRAGDERVSPDQPRLMNRRCVTVVSGQLLSVYVTAPFKSDVEQAVNRAQLAFIAGLADQVIRGNAPAARPPGGGSAPGSGGPGSGGPGAAIGGAPGSGGSGSGNPGSGGPGASIGRPPGGGSNGSGPSGGGPSGGGPSGGGSNGPAQLMPREAPTAGRPGGEAPPAVPSPDGSGKPPPARPPGGPGGGIPGGGIPGGGTIGGGASGAPGALRPGTGDGMMIVPRAPVVPGGAGKASAI